MRPMPRVPPVTRAVLPAVENRSLTAVLLGGRVSAGGQREELRAGARVVAQAAVQGGGDGAGARAPAPPGSLMHMCSASSTTPTPLGARCSCSQLAICLRQPLLHLQPAGEQLDDAGELGQPEDAVARQVGHVRDADERAAGGARTARRTGCRGRRRARRSPPRWGTSSGRTPAARAARRTPPPPDAGVSRSDSLVTSCPSATSRSATAAAAAAWSTALGTGGSVTRASCPRRRRVPMVGP